MDVRLPRTAAALLAALLPACSVFTDYPAEARAATDHFEGGAFEEAALAFEEDFGALESNKFLALAEAGMARHVGGDLDGATATWIAAGAELDSYGDRPTVSGRGLSEGALSLILNDKTLPYDGEGFEAALLHAFMAWDFLRLGDLDGAMVEVQRGYQLETIEEDRYATTYGMNRFARFVAALAQEFDGAPDEARIDLQRLAEELPEHPAVAYSLDKVQALRAPGRNEVAARAELVVVYEKGRMPAKVAKEFSYATRRTISKFSIPAFGPAALEPLTVEALLDGASLGRTHVLEDVLGVAHRNLDDRMALLVAKAAARSAAKAVVIDGVAEQVENEHGDGWGFVAGMVGAILIGLTERADLRSWLTLPQEVQVMRVEVPPGEHRLVLRASGSDEKDLGIVEFLPGRTVLIGARSLGGRLHVVLPPGLRPVLPEPDPANLNP